MRTRRLWMLAVSLLFLAADAMAQGSTEVTQWQGSAQIATNGATFTIPVHLQLEGNGSTLVGSFVDGPQRTTSTSGELSGQDVTLHFADYAVTFHGQIVGDQLTGNYSADNGRFSYPVTLRPAPKGAAVHSTANVPNIGSLSGRMPKTYPLPSCGSTVIPAPFTATTRTVALSSATFRKSVRLCWK
jgi:hypothetical protein